MKRSNKKGFTIVELVIVIAIIAVLAAVLIPTFSGIIKKANVANDTAVAKNMNEALATYAATNGDVNDFEKVLAAIEEAGYVLANLNAKANGNLYAWDKANNQIVYLDAAGETIYKNTDFNKADLMVVVANGSVALPEGVTTTNVIDMTKPAGAKALLAAIDEGLSVTIQNDIKIDRDIIIPEGADVTIDLGDKTITTTCLNEGDPHNQKSQYVQVRAGAKLTVKNGTLSARGIMNYGELVIDGVTVNAVDYGGGGCIRNKAGAKVTINSGTFKVMNAGYPNDEGSTYFSACAIDNAGGEVIINGGEFISEHEVATMLVHNQAGTLTINGGTFTSHSGVFSLNGGTVTVKNATINWGDPAKKAQHLFYFGETATLVLEEGNTFNVTTGAKGSYIYNTVGGTVTNNGGYTWANN